VWHRFPLGVKHHTCHEGTAGNSVRKSEWPPSFCCFPKSHGAIFWGSMSWTPSPWQLLLSVFLYLPIRIFYTTCDLLVCCFISRFSRFSWVVAHIRASFLLLSAIVGFELRVLCLLGRWSTTWVTPPTTFAFSYFLHKVLFLCQGHPGPQSSYLCFPQGWVTGVHYTPSFLSVEMNLANCPKMSSNHHPPNLHLQSI
jgi:hypothetical protein